MCVLQSSGKLSSVHLSFDDPAYFGPLFFGVGRHNHTYECVRYCAPAAVHERLINSTTPSSGQLEKCFITMTDRPNYIR